jgi:hypothetical protein
MGYEEVEQEPYYEEDGTAPWWDIPIYSPNPKKHTTVLMTSDHAAHPMSIDAAGTIVSNSKACICCVISLSVLYVLFSYFYPRFSSDK